MEETPPTNELIERLAARLSPEGREVQAELDAVAGTLDADMPKEGILALADRAVARMGALPERDRDLLEQIAQLKARVHERRAEENQEAADVARAGVAAFERAEELERGTGRELPEGATLADVLAILEAHGEDAPEIDTARVVEVESMEERTVPAYVPRWTDANMMEPYDGSRRAQVWAALLDYREEAIAESAAHVLAAGPDRQTDLTGVVSMLWGLDDEEAAEILGRRSAEIAGRAAELAD